MGMILALSLVLFAILGRSKFVNVTNNLPYTLVAQKNSTAASTADQNAAAAAPTGAPTPAGFIPIDKSDVVSGISTTLSSGVKLSMVRLDLSKSGLNAAPSDAPPPAPTAEDKSADQTMLNEFSQMAAYFKQSITAQNTTLEGTAALDLTI
jgi:hypothetical protein